MYRIVSNCEFVKHLFVLNFTLGRGRNPLPDWVLPIKRFGIFFDNLKFFKVLSSEPSLVIKLDALNAELQYFPAQGFRIQYLEPKGCKQSALLLSFGGKSGLGLVFQLLHLLKKGVIPKTLPSLDGEGQDGVIPDTYRVFKVLPSEPSLVIKLDALNIEFQYHPAQGFRIQYLEPKGTSYTVIAGRSNSPDPQSQGLVADTHKRCNELHPTKLQMREVVEQDWFNPHQEIQALKISC